MGSVGIYVHSDDITRDVVEKYLGENTRSGNEVLYSSWQATVDVALAQIERQYGKGAVMRLGEHAAGQGISVIPTGSLALDIAIQKPLPEITDDMTEEEREAVYRELVKMPARSR